MNLFFLSWNLPINARAGVKSQFIKMKPIFPLLDVETISVFGDIGPIYAVCMSNPLTVCHPRQYVSQNKDHVTIFDGCLVDMKDKMAANRADQLAIHWDTLEDRIEGHFFAAKMDFNVPKLEIKNDYLGFHPVYYRRVGDAWVISNSIHLINKIIGRTGFDPIGISMFVGFGGWVGGDRTLDSEVFILPGGQHWTWSGDQKEPIKKTYFPRSRFVLQKKGNLTGLIEELGDELSSMLCLIPKNYGGVIDAPITAGKDSRLITSVLLKNGIDAMFFTGGDPNSIDFTIGGYIARRLKLKHNVNKEIVNDDIVLDNWDANVERMLNVTDGMVTLAHIANVAKPPEEVAALNIHLYGAGGEIGRKWFEDTQFYFLNGLGKKYVLQTLNKTCIKNSNLILPEARAACQKHLNTFVDEALDDGYALADLPTVFCTYELIRRWGGGNYRQIVSYTDVFVPLCTKPFVRAALSLSPIQRYSDLLHYELTKINAPELFELPLEFEWKSQSTIANYAKLLSAPVHQRILRKPILRFLEKPSHGTKRPNRETERLNWFENKRSAIRERCLDDESSVVWESIDRNRFEQLTRSDSQSDERKRHIKVLYDAVTAIYYCQL